MFHNYETIVTQLRDARLTSMKRAKLPSNCKAISIECPSKSTPILPFRTTISRLPLDNSAFTAHRARLTDQEIRLTGNWHFLLSGSFNCLFRTLLFLLLFFWSSRFAGTFFGLFLRLFFCYLCRSFLYGNATVGIIRQYTCPKPSVSILPETAGHHKFFFQSHEVSSPIYRSIRQISGVPHG